MMNQKINDVGIYTITCIQTNKSYIGSSYRLQRRWYEHKHELNNNAHKNIHLQRAWNKYGKASFVFKVQEYIEDKANLLSIEQEYLDKWWVSGKLYNTSKKAGIGPDCTGIKRSLETKKRMSEAHKGITNSPETRAKLSKLQSGKNNSSYGKSPSKETKEKISNSMKRYFRGKKYIGDDVVQLQEENEQGRATPESKEDGDSSKRDFREPK